MSRKKRQRGEIVTRRFLNISNINYIQLRLFKGNTCSILKGGRGVVVSSTTTSACYCPKPSNYTLPHKTYMLTVTPWINYRQQEYCGAVKVFGVPLILDRILPSGDTDRISSELVMEMTSITNHLHVHLRKYQCIHMWMHVEQHVHQAI